MNSACSKLRILHLKKRSDIDILQFNIDTSGFYTDALLCFGRGKSSKNAPWAQPQSMTKCSTHTKVYFIPNMLRIASLGSLCIQVAWCNQIYLGKELTEDEELND